MKQLLWLILLIIIAACATQPASRTPPPALPTTALLQIGVVSSAEPIIPLLEASYAPENPQVTLQFVVGNHSALLADLANGLLDAVLVHHIPEGNGRYFNPVALDGVAIVTHPDNPVNTLTRAEVQAIFNGRLTNWQAVGGRDEAIVLLSREPGSGLGILLRQRVMAEQRISPNVLLQAGNEAMLTAVANNPAAVGFSSMGSATQHSGVKIVMVDGRSATQSSTRDQTYPLTTPLYFLAATEAEPTGELRAFLAWLQSDAGQTVLGDLYGRIR
ncbi:substrate-binding domain-containing protein [Candidatus Leptofilum sp.]|uniref:substrate-binding domain-containing protein n=1 Tax=Candidatus Leptofilum sp. TaxID=3241576 RepID=UPI003B5BA82B